MDSDFLVIGSGLAGLTFALKAARHGTVVVVTKDSLPESATAYAQGGIASVWSAEDSFEDHSQDTMRAGAGLCHADIVDLVVHEGPERIRELIALGTRFSVRSGAHGAADPADESDYDLGREGGHSHRRILHALDATGREIMRALVDAVRREPNVVVLERHLAVDLLIDAKFDPSINASACWGAYVLEMDSGTVTRFRARATLLATGGIGKVYLYTSNPDIATGDGVAAAYRAGVPIGNMEFVQFHPTCLYHPQAKSFLISEALRGEGAVLRTPDGDAFMRRYHADAELAPRDIVARAIDNEMKVHGYEHVYLDISHRGADYVRQRFPHIYERCASFGIDIGTQPIPVVPAAHYCCGGAVTDAHGATTIGRLFAAGEVAMTGLHGANRLASNSLLEALVFGHRAAVAAAAVVRADRAPLPALPPWNAGEAVDSDESVVVTQNWDEIRRVMWNYVGIVRSNRRLARALKRILLLQEEIHDYYWNFHITADLIELRNIALVAELIVKSAIRRTESRGLHYNIDYPERDDAHGRHDTVLQPGVPFEPGSKFYASLRRDGGTPPAAGGSALMFGADDILIFSGSGSPKLTAHICEYLGIAQAEGEVLRFSEGNLFVRVKENVRGRRTYVVQSTVFPTNDNFMELLFWIDALKRASADSVTVVMPYFSYAKGDKKDEPRVSIRARVCAEALEAAGADRVVTLDLHAPQIQGFFRIPVDVMHALPVLCDALARKQLRDLVVVSPDTGFAKQARRFASFLGASLAIADKQRKDHNETAEVLEIIGDVQRKTAVIVDDFTISAGTLVSAAEQLVARGATAVYAMVSHGVFTQGSMQRLDRSPIQRLLVTDSIETQPVIFSEKIEIVSVAPLFGEAIRRIHNRESISVLFPE